MCLTGGSAYGLAAADGVMTLARVASARRSGRPPMPSHARRAGRAGSGDLRPRPRRRVRQPARCRRSVSGRSRRPARIKRRWGTCRCRTRAPGRRAAGRGRHGQPARPDSRRRGRSTDRRDRRCARRRQRHRLDRRPGDAAAMGTERPDAAGGRSRSERAALVAALDGQAATAAGSTPRSASSPPRGARRKAEAGKLASVAHDGLARAIRPAHSMFDGDTIFGLATGARRAHRGARPDCGFRVTQRRAQPAARGRRRRRSPPPAPHAVLSRPPLGALPTLPRPLPVGEAG